MADIPGMAAKAGNHPGEELCLRGKVDQKR
jgi:hypothetical protein